MERLPAIRNLEDEQMLERLLRQMHVSRHEPTRTKQRPAHEEIELRAYHIFLERGGLHGQDVEDWLEAERQLLAETQEAPSA
jgi:hypothetical protein